jgi:hypothetical protein
VTDKLERDRHETKHATYFRRATRESKKGISRRVELPDTESSIGQKATLPQSGLTGEKPGQNFRGIRDRKSQEGIKENKAPAFGSHLENRLLENHVSIEEHTDSGRHVYSADHCDMDVTAPSSYVDDDEADNFWEWDQGCQKFRHYDLETATWIYCPDELD